MCFGKKEKPRPSASPQEKSGRQSEPGPRPARNPPAASQPRALDQPLVSRRQWRRRYHVALWRNHMDSQPRGGGSRRARSLDRTDPRRASGRLSGLDRPPVDATGDSPSRERRTERRRSRYITPGLDRGIIIALMGVTGAGKSYFIREVTGNPEVKVSGGLYSSTSKVQSYSFEYLGERVTLVDTPGFNDTERSDAEVLKEIADWTSKAYKRNQLLSGIIYLHPITRTRMESSAMRSLRIFQNLCGQEVLENVLLTTTQWSNVDPVEGQAREDNFRDEGLWGGLIAKGATLQRFNGTRESGLELIGKLVSKTRKPLYIQDEIVRQHMTLPETNAGKCVNEELVAQEEKFKERLGSLEKRLQEAMGTMGTMGTMGCGLKSLMEEQAKSQKKLEKVEAGMKLLAELHAAQAKSAKPGREKRARWRDLGSDGTDGCSNSG